MSFLTTIGEESCTMTSGEIAIGFFCADLYWNATLNLVCGCDWWED